MNEAPFEARVFDFAKYCVLEKGELVPSFHAVTKDDKHYVFATPFFGKDNDEAENAKKSILSVLRMTFDFLGVSKYAFYSEAWFKTFKESEAHFRKRYIADEPDRIECLILYFISDSSRKLITYEMKRDAAGKLTGLKPFREATEGISGRMTELLAGNRKVISFHEKLLVKKFLKEFGRSI